MIVTLTMEWLVCFYWLVEMYVFVYCQEAQIKSQLEHFDRLAQLEIDCTYTVVESQPTLAVTNKEVVKPIQVTVSELDTAAEGLISQMQQELSLIDSNPLESSNFDEGYDMSQDSGFEMFSLADAEQYEEDCIQLSDLQEREEDLSTGYEQFASSKIADCIDGPQQWVVSIVGMEETYIHVSDGKRLWINVGEKASKLRNGDALILDVIRNGKEVIVDNIVKCETNASEEYIIPDEIHYYQEERIAI